MPYATATDGIRLFYEEVGTGTLVVFVPLITYDQNVGTVMLTGVGSRFVVAVGGAFLIVMALLPKVGAIIGIVPPFVLGGTLIFLFGMILAVGIGIPVDGMKSQRDTVLLAASVGLSMTVNFAPPAVVAILPPSIRALAGDGIVVGTVTAILLNLVLPKRG